jgi:hypothetical protein
MTLLTLLTLLTLMTRKRLLPPREPGMRPFLPLGFDLEKVFEQPVFTDRYKYTHPVGLKRARLLGSTKCVLDYFAGIVI